MCVTHCKIDKLYVFLGVFLYIAMLPVLFFCFMNTKRCVCASGVQTYPCLELCAFCRILMTRPLETVHSNLEFFVAMLDFIC